MLGARLTYHQRRAIGIFCRDNKIGWFAATPEERAENGRKGLATQKREIENGEREKEDSFVFWASSEGRSERARMGGKIGGRRSKENKSGYHNPDKLKMWASMGGKALMGYICVHKPGEETFTRIKPEALDEYLNNGYELNTGLKYGKYKIMYGADNVRHKIRMENIDDALKNGLLLASPNPQEHKRYYVRHPEDGTVIGIRKEEISKYIADGWVKGGTAYGSKLVRVKHPETGKSLRIPENDLAGFIERGYEINHVIRKDKGTKREGRFMVKIGEKAVFVQTSYIQEKLNAGYVFGMKIK